MPFARRLSATQADMFGSVTEVGHQCAHGFGVGVRLGCAQVER
jgi:hypothetical protein